MTGRIAFRSLCAGFILSVMCTPAAYAVTFSSASVNSTYAFFNNEDGTTRDNTGAAVSRSSDSGGFQNYGISKGYTDAQGSVVVKQVSSTVSASASLATAELKTLTQLQFGNDLFGGPALPGGVGSQSSAAATFADTFVFQDAASNTPFIFGSGETVRFQLGITGETLTSPEIVSPQPDGTGFFPAPGEPDNQLLSRVLFRAGRPGYLATVEQINNFDFDAYPDFDVALIALQSLIAQAEVLTIHTDFKVLGDYIAPDAGSTNPADILAVDPVNPADLIFEFAPGGDFEWYVTLETNVRLDRSLTNVTATHDFSHTVLTTFQGPDGATVYSESGLFPNTLPTSDLTDDGAAVPEPASAALSLLALGALAVGATRRRLAA